MADSNKKNKDSDKGTSEKKSRRFEESRDWKVLKKDTKKTTKKDTKKGED